MRINHNITALNTYRQYNTANNAQAKSMEKLSSGQRINNAADDAAGLAISEKMRGQIRGLDQAGRNAQDGVSLIQTAEGALSETTDILQRMRELAVQSSNDTNQNDVDREAISSEITALKDEIDRISDTTQFNGKKLLNGTLGSKIDTNTTNTTAFVKGVSSITTSGSTAQEYAISVDATAKTITLTGADDSKEQTLSLKDGAQTLNFSDLGITMKTNAGYAITGNETDGKKITVLADETKFQIGANADQEVGLSINDMSTTGLEINNVDVSTREGAKAAITTIGDAINTVSTQRSNLGALQNRLEHTINNLNNQSENLTASESRIRDVDMAKEMMEQTKNSILSQASQAMLGQANQQPQNVLQLLR
ncbi:MULTISPECIES: flagellin [Priestia]|uniref:flagellin N-terminal helical domain-containing protein n=1 Tax=Priestia TaxID=2800373 RepID=UPI0005ECA534|nr:MULTISPECIES: flagellin [Priestia]KJL02800.1 flagellin [Priestia aryabhattai B8W22]MBX4160823.1 flagellin [Priestia megaterium]